MKLETFFENFELLADAPNGVKRLRELILQLAVQGKLVPQDPKDEPASILIKKIKAEKERLVKEKTINNARALPTIDEDEIPYNLPKEWQWARLGDVCHDWGQKKPDVEFTYIDVSAIDKEHGIISADVKTLKPNEAPSRARKIVSKGTVIYATVRPYLLNIAIIDKEVKPEPIVSTAFAVLHPLSGVLNRYLYYYLRSKPFIAYVESEMTGMAYPAINDGKLYMGLVPLPPSDEQHCIVAKVDQLMSLCDELEARQQKKCESRARLNNAALDRLLAARAPEEFAQGWRHVCENFELLYDTPENVGALRQAILQLAVMGKLAPQDPNDIPASVLLEKIKTLKERLIKEKKIKKEKSLPPIVLEKAPFELLESWIWLRLGEITKAIEYGTSYKSSENNIGVPVFRMNNIDRGKVIHENLKYVPNFIDDLPRLFLQNNDILFNRTNSYELVGKTGIFKGDADAYTFASYLIRVSLFLDYIHPEYVNLAMNSGYFRKTQIEPEIIQQCGQANFNGTKLANTVIPLPPLEEQRRIVAMVNQLMSLCDSLEAGLLRSQADGEELMEAVVGRMLAR